MASPPSSSAPFERAFALPEAAGASPRLLSRRNSEIQQVDGSQSNQGSASLDAPYQSQSASWDTVDFSSARTTSPGFPYTPSYRDQYTPYGSDSGLSWTGRESGNNQLYDEPTDAAEVEYNPADFDGPGSQSNVTSPYFLEQDGRSGMGSDYMSSNGFNDNNNGISHQLSSGDHLSLRGRSYSTDTNKSLSAAGTPHARMNSLDVNSFSPRPISAGSPASSVGGLDIERPRSRASSISSMHQATPSLTVNPIGEFEKMGFDSVDSDILWRQGQGQQGVAKAQSPPQLLIPSETPNSTLQIPSFGNPNATLGAGLNTGSLGLSAPGINILPATPVSGGAGASNVPFDTVLKNLNERRQASGSNEDNIRIMPSHGTTFPNQTSSRPSTPGPAAPAAATYNFPFNSSSPAPATFEFPSSSSNNISSASNQTLNNFLDFPGSNNNNNPRPRALSDTSVRPVMTAVESQPMMPSFLGSHPSITAGHYSPSLNSHTPPLSSMGRTMANHRSNSFGSSDPIALHFNPSHDVAFNGLDNNLGADLRRARFDANRHRSSRSEDFRSASPFQPPEFLAPQAAYGQNTGYGYGGPIRAQDLMGTNMPSSIGPTRHARRLSSGSPYPERPGSVSSARPSPYPSPNGSPSHNQQGLPPSGMQDGELGSDGNPWAKVERQQVTTPATAKASEGRRKGEASFVCPVPGCGSTFTRHFNLKGHLRSHNEERPFKCKWPGCEKGFARQHDCKRHEALHLNLRPYTCDGCKKTFARMDALNRHLKSEGGIDCARAQENDGGLFEMSMTKTEDAHGWPAMNARANGTLAM